MKKYTFDVNGLTTKAIYSEEAVDHIFLPLLRGWTQMRQEKKRRIILFLSAPPGVGKTTLAQFLEYLSTQDDTVEDIQAIGLDGFHYHQDYILAHTVDVNGEKMPMKDVKGCLETFDLEKLKEKLSELKNKEVKWPVYNRIIHDVQEDAVTVTKNIILIEGNWLLSTEGDWRGLIDVCDDSIFISAGEEILKDRLVQRKIDGGLSPKEAEAFCENSDLKNVRRLLENHHMGRINLVMTANGDYQFEHIGERV